MKRRVVHTNMPIISLVAVPASLTLAAQAANCSTATMAGNWAFKNLIRRGFAGGLLVLLLCLATFGQVVTAVPQLTEAQAQALLLAGQAGIPLTPEQSQMLVYYLLQKNHPAAGLAYLTPAQVQAMQAQLPQGANPAGAGVVGSGTTQQTAATIQNAATVAEKKPGTVRIGVVMPKAQLGQGAGPAAGEALRSILMQYLSGPAIEIIPITALLPQQIEAEGAAKHCDYLAYTSFVVKKSSGGMGFLKGASIFGGMIPIAGGAGSMGGAIAETTAIALAEEAAALSSGITAKSQVVMDYRLSVPGSNAPVLSKSLTAKATTDGEDIITPLIEQEATAILAEATKAK